MKFKKAISVLSIGVVLISFSGCEPKVENSVTNNEAKTEIVNEVQEKYIDKNSIEYTGWLRTERSALVNEKGEPIQLKGLSSHGIQWFPEVLTYENLKQLKDEWKINVFRIAMYTDPNANGYIAHPESSKEEVYKIVEFAKKLDMYVIIDWHILNDNNPQIYQTQAKAFFEEVAERYSNVPNVLYEICNEPNGGDVTWNNNVKPYAQDIINTIRSKSPKALIIVGTPDWSKDLKSVADSPLQYNNVIYSCHFYAGTHGSELQESINYCLEKNIPVFVSECGITNASGAGDIYVEKFKKWINFLSEKNISWVYWSFCNKDEGSSILSPNFPSSSNADNQNNSSQNGMNSTNINNYLTEAGKCIKELI